MPRRPLRVLVAAAVTAAVSVGALPGAAGPEPVAAYPAETVDLVGHGFGHGRGMGQYGALGGALAGVPYTTILDHFYGGTRMGTVGDTPISVRILRLDGQDTIAIQERGAATVSAVPDRQFPALRTRRVGPNSFEVSSGLGCGGPWTVVAPAVPGPVTLGSALPAGDDRTTMLQLCEPAGTRWYRGDFTVLDSGGARTVNRLPLEAYLRGVVPRESPNSWGTLGGGRGMHALRAQAVVARSYALASNNTPYAKTCDTTACQVYGGFAVQDGAGYRDLEAATTNAAVTETTGQVRVFTVTGAVALTEFSSSTGGYSAGGVFPAVVDDGDATPLNPNHNWSARVPVADVQAAYPAIGTLQSVDVVRRNGLGDLGGRVLELVLRGDRGSQVLTGADFRRFPGVRSDWFAVTNNAEGGIAGYWVLAPDGGVFPFGAATFHGSMGGRRLNRPIVGMAPTPSGRGYWLVASDGGIFAFGDALFRGSTGAIRLNQPIVGMAPTPSGRGYWLVASDGGIFAFGDALFRGSTGAIRLNQPIVGMAPTPSGRGYWLVASDGGIFAFGDALFRGSTGAIRLNQPIVGMAPTPSGSGYWLVASDGGIFAFGDAVFRGSTGAIRLNQPIVGMAPTPSGNGYWLVASDGGVFSFGDAVFRGSLPGIGAPGPARAIQPVASGQGYLIATDGGRVHAFGNAPFLGDVASSVAGYAGGVRGLATVRTR